MEKNIYIVVVIYRCHISKSDTIKSLLSIQDVDYSNRVLVYDNSPEDFEQETISNGMSYIRDVNNNSLAYAYNKAVSIAKSKGCKWLMLLDQDSVLDNEIFVEFDNICQNNIEIGMIVPHVVSHTNKIISPHYRKIGERINEGIHNHLFCINSFSIINIDFVINILKGFNEDFPLDMLDYYTCYCINKSEYKYYVMNCVMKHNLSVYNKCYVGMKRYESIVGAEYKFYCMIGKKKLYIFRLVCRSMKMLTHRQISHAIYNFRFILQQLIF